MKTGDIVQRRFTTAPSNTLALWMTKMARTDSEDMREESDLKCLHILFN